MFSNYHTVISYYNYQVALLVAAVGQDKLNRALQGMGDVFWNVYGLVIWMLVYVKYRDLKQYTKKWRYSFVLLYTQYWNVFDSPHVNWCTTFTSSLYMYIFFTHKKTNNIYHKLARSIDSYI